MNQADLTLLDQAIHNQLLLSRFIAGEQGKVYALILEMQKELRGKFLDGDLTDFSRARVKALLKQCDEIIVQGYNSIQGQLDLQDIGQYAAETTAQSFTAIGLEASLPTVAVMKALVNGSVIEGSAAKLWWEKQSTDLQFKFANAVRQGIAQGETMQQMITRVFGSKKLGTPGIGFPADLLRRQASALVHASVMSVCTDARIATFQANADIIDSLVWLATLDGHTCPTICGPRDLKRYDLMTLAPIGHSLPWGAGPGKIHFGCRCTPISKTKTFKELGADIPEPPTGTRASDEGQVSAGTDFESFLGRKDKAYIEDMMGPGRAEMYLKGKITLQDLTSGAGRPLTLEQLRGKK